MKAQDSMYRILAIMLDATARCDNSVQQRSTNGAPNKPSLFAGKSSLVVFAPIVLEGILQLHVHVMRKAHLL